MLRLKRQTKSLNAQLHKAITKRLPKDTGYAIVYFDVRKEESSVNYFSNMPKKTINRIYRFVFKEWRRKYEI